MKPQLLNGGNLAFIGDAYYELCVREHVLKKGLTNPNDLHKECVKYVSAKAHNFIIEKMKDFFSDEELVYFKRGRNHSDSGNRKNIIKSEHQNSSGFEAVLGYLYLTMQKERLEEIINMAFRMIEEANE